MRQAGIIAAGALYALKHHRERLQADHSNAKILAAGLHQIADIEIDPAAVQTNIVIFHTKKIPALLLAQRLKEKGVALLATGENSLRAVTNLMVTEEQILQVPELVQSAICSLSEAMSDTGRIPVPQSMK